MSTSDRQNVRDRLRVHPAPTRPSGTLSRYERQKLFREMVVGELHQGPLNRYRRYRLVRYAAMLDISAAHAGTLIGEARRAFEQSVTGGATVQPHVRLAEPAQPWPLWVKLSLVLAVAAVLRATVVRWFFV